MKIHLGSTSKGTLLWLYTLPTIHILSLHVDFIQTQTFRKQN